MNKSSTGCLPGSSRAAGGWRICSKPAAVRARIRSRIGARQVRTLNCSWQARYLISMATSTQVTVEEYLRTSYHPDCEYVDGEVLDRNVGRKRHSKVQARPHQLPDGARKGIRQLYFCQEWRDVAPGEARGIASPTWSSSLDPSPTRKCFSTPGDWSALRFFRRKIE